MRQEVQMKFLWVLVLGLVLALGGIGHTQTTTTTTTSTTLAANSATLTWTVKVHISQLPGQAPDITATCAGLTAASPYCETGVGTLSLNFLAPDTSHFEVRFDPQYVCGATFGKCNPVTNAADINTKSVSATCTPGVSYAASDSFRAYFPASCGACFGGTSPSFLVSWSATSSSC